MYGVDQECAVCGARYRSCVIGACPRCTGALGPPPLPLVPVEVEFSLTRPDISDPTQEATMKKPLTGLFRDNPSTPEGKYLVKRRDGSVPPWPSFVLGGADPIAEVALRAYADEAERICVDKPEEAAHLGITLQWIDALRRWVDKFREWREKHGAGDPGRGPHRKDDPATVEEMRKGY
jgi:hypothetical protein